MSEQSVASGSYLPITAEAVESVLAEAKISPDDVVNGEWGYIMANILV